MAHLKAHGQLLFGHQFPGDSHILVIQRTMVVRNEDTDVVFQQSELTPLTIANDFAADPSFRSLFLSGDSPETVDLGLTTITNNAVLDLQQQHRTLLLQLDNLCSFLRSLGNNVTQADVVAFREQSNPDHPVVRIASAQDLEGLRTSVFTEKQVRQWVADSIARRGD